MFSPELKEEISGKIQNMLQAIGHRELPLGEIEFLLHVDGKQDWSWVNIRNRYSRNRPAPSDLLKNTTA